MAATNPDSSPRVTGRAKLAGGRFIELSELTWTDREGAARKWESADRVDGTQAALMITTLKPSDRLVLVRQFRPPAGGVVIEFPAGLIDAGETPEQAALRELKEETGYAGRVIACTPPALSSPGFTGEALHICTVEIDEDAPENQGATATPEEGEQIEILLVARRELGAFLKDAASRGTLLDAKLIAYALAAGCG